MCPSEARDSREHGRVRKRGRWKGVLHGPVRTDTRFLYSVRHQCPRTWSELVLSEGPGFLGFRFASDNRR